MSEPSPNSPSPLPPPSTEELARRLKARLANERPRTTRYVLLALAVVVAGLSAMAWYLRPQPAPGRWTVVAFDDWALEGQPVARRARIEALLADEPPGSPRGQEIFFRGVDQAESEFVKGAADAQGEATAEGNAKEPGFVVLYLGPQRKYKAEDRGRHFHFAPQTRLLAVDVDETVADAPTDEWGTRNPQSVAVKRPAALALTALAKQGYQIVYLSRRVATAKDCQRIRSWAQLHRSEGLPEGPVLADVPAEKESPAAAGQRLLADLRKRWQGPLMLVVGSEASAEAGKAAGITTYLVGDAKGKSWSDVSDELVKAIGR